MRERSWLRLLLWVTAYSLAGCVLLAGVGSMVLKKPFLITPIRSNSMYPLLKKGDIAIIYPLAVNAGNIHIGDVIVFRAEGGSLEAQGWVIHRVIGGDPETGFITKGDANQQDDQISGGAKPVRREAIVAKAVSLGGRPVKLSLLGYPSLWLESVSRGPYMVPGVLGAAGAILLVSELTTKRRKRKRAAQWPIYLLCGLITSVVMAAVQLSGSTFISYEYEVSDQSQGAIMGSDIGIVLLGETVSRPVTEITGKGFLPMVVSVTTSDPRIDFNTDFFVTKPGAKQQVTLSMSADRVGSYKSQVMVGLFLPTMPPAVIHALAQKSYWLALLVVSVIPGIPMFCLALLDSRSRRMLRRLAASMPLK